MARVRDRAIGPGETLFPSPTVRFARLASANRPSLPLSTFQVTKKMDKKKQDKHSRVKTFIKTVNGNHLITLHPRRDLKVTVTPTR